jgi:uncharacterized protein (DUF1697 family)
MIYISLLRGINVSGKNPLAMPDLKQMYESLGFVNVQTYIQSGNITFDAPKQDPEGLAKRIQTQIKVSFGFEVPVIVRTDQEFQNILENNPFLIKRQENINYLHVTFLATSPTTERAQKIRSVPQVGDEFILVGSEVYLFCPGGYGRTKYSNTFFEKKLERIATTRNWKSVIALANLAKSR